jgi:replication factor A1
MAEGNYEKILERISRASGVGKEEIERKVEAKRAKLSGLISKEGAAQVIASELGINFDNEKLKINELLSGMRKANVVGKVINLSPVRSFNKNGKEGKVANIIIADETSNLKVVLWDTHHIDLIERKKISEGSVIEILNASMRENELHLGSFSELKLSDEILENVKTERIMKEKKISEFKPQEAVSTRAFIVQTFEPRFFYICPQCKKKATPENEKYICNEHGNVLPEKRVLINIVLDDGSETIRTVLFHENVSLLGISEFENPPMLIQQRENVLGKEMFFTGNVRTNKFFNNTEFIADSVKEVELDKLIEKLEGKI